MTAFVDALQAQWQATSALEAVAVLLAIAYLWLAIRENIWCWACAAASTAIYVYLFGDVRLYMESLLNAYYLAMAGYGWYTWHKGQQANSRKPVVRWPLRLHLAAIGGIGIVASLNGWLLAAHTDAAWPYLDSATTWAAVWTTFLVARKVLENWWYWLVIDAVSIFLYLERGLPLTALLFVLYVGMIPFGWRRWRASWQAAQTA